MRLNYDAKIIKKYPVKRDLAQLGYNYITNDNYVTTFWRESSETGISVDDFITTYKHIDYMLEEQGITVEREMPEVDGDFNELTKKFISKIRLMEDGVPPERQKSLSAIEHDAYNLALVFSNRKNYCYNFIDADIWFLTTDYLLIKMQKFDHELKNKTPLVLLPSQLIQILRFITPSGSSYDQTYIQLFANSFRSEDTIVTDPEIIPQILARINKLNGTPI